ncbi:MAG: RNA methyltransferase [Candidatus Micrarchaeota archaeon]
MAKPEFRIILVGTEYELNLGAVARLMANFGCSPLYLVAPACNPLGFTARMHAKHAVKILEKAVVCETLPKALEGCSFVVGTTGVLRRHKQALRHPLSLEQLRERMSKNKIPGTIAVLFGPEGNGLAEGHIKRCDVLMSIPASRRYPVLNLSHALAVVLYALIAQGRSLKSVCVPSDAREAEFLKKAFDRLASRYSPNLNNPEKTKLAFRRVLGRAVPDAAEVRAMLAVVHQALRELEAKKKG